MARPRWLPSQGEAGVALKTVYLAFETKGGVLRALWNLRLRGDRDEIPIARQRWYREVLEEPDPERQLRLNARNSARRQASNRRGARGHPQRSLRSIATSPRSGIGSRPTTSANQRAIVESLERRRTPYGRGLDVDRGADILWTINHPNTWQLLVSERGCGLASDDGAGGGCRSTGSPTPVAVATRRRPAVPERALRRSLRSRSATSATRLESHALGREASLVLSDGAKVLGEGGVLGGPCARGFGVARHRTPGRRERSGCIAFAVPAKQAAGDIPVRARTRASARKWECEKKKHRIDKDVEATASGARAAAHGRRGCLRSSPSPSPTASPSRTGAG